MVRDQLDKSPAPSYSPHLGEYKITNENTGGPRTSWRQRGVSFGVGAVRQGKL